MCRACGDAWAKGSPRRSSRGSPPASARGRGAAEARERSWSDATAGCRVRCSIARDRGAAVGRGATCIDVGLAPTPTIQLAVEHAHAAGGLAITASHNPIEWNALKFIGPRACFSTQRKGPKCERRRGGHSPRDLGRLGVVETDTGASRVTLTPCWRSVHRRRGIRTRSFHVALDLSRRRRRIMPAAAGAPWLPGDRDQSGTGRKVPASPEPVAENLGELESSCGIGRGCRLGGRSGCRSAGAVVRRKAGRSARTTRWLLRPSRAPARLRDRRHESLDEPNRRRHRQRGGSRVIRAPVGEVNVAIAMRAKARRRRRRERRRDSARSFTWVAMRRLAAALMLQLLRGGGQTLSAIVASYPRYAIVKDKLDRPPRPLDAVYEALARRPSRMPRWIRRTDFV